MFIIGNGNRVNPINDAVVAYKSSTINLTPVVARNRPEKLKRFH